MRNSYVHAQAVAKSKSSSASRLVGMVLVVAWKLSATHTQSPVQSSTLTQMEVVVLRIADNEEEHDGVDDG